jgi:hypothetical protein
VPKNPAQLPLHDLLRLAGFDTLAPDLIVIFSFLIFLLGVDTKFPAGFDHYLEILRYGRIEENSLSNDEISTFPAIWMLFVSLDLIGRARFNIAEPALLNKQSLFPSVSLSWRISVWLTMHNNASWRAF